MFLKIFLYMLCHFSNSAVIILLKKILKNLVEIFTCFLCSFVLESQRKKKVSLLMFVSAAGSQSKTGYFGERIRAWEGQRGLSFLQNMELRGGELLVPRAGLYYIYAQTYFRLPSTGDTDGETEEGAELVQYIYKKVQLLLRN